MLLLQMASVPSGIDAYGKLYAETSSDGVRRHLRVMLLKRYVPEHQHAPLPSALDTSAHKLMPQHRVNMSALQAGVSGLEPAK